MNRRDFLGLLGLAGAGLFLDSGLGLAETSHDGSRPWRGLRLGRRSGPGRKAAGHDRDRLAPARQDPARPRGPLARHPENDGHPPTVGRRRCIFAAPLPLRILCAKSGASSSTATACWSIPGIPTGCSTTSSARGWGCSPLPRRKRNTCIPTPLANVWPGSFRRIGWKRRRRCAGT